MEFIEKYPKVDGSDDEEEMSVAGGDEVTTYSDEEFIDDRESVQDQDPSDYRLINVNRDLQDPLVDHSMAEELDLVCSDHENFVPDCVEEIELEYDEFENFEKRIKKFEEDLKTLCSTQKTHFFMQFLMDFIIQSYNHSQNI